VSLCQKRVAQRAPLADVATLHELQVHLGTLAAILWNYGASFPVPVLEQYVDTGNVGFELTAELSGSDTPKPALIKLSEIWTPVRQGDFVRREYEYDLFEHPLDRRRAFHGHHPEHFAREFHVLVHEHCEEVLGQPACDHYFGLPVDGYEAIRRFASVWGRPTPLGCANLLCMT
jgi:hypothetical protein